MAKIQLIIMYAIYAVFVVIATMVNNDAPYRLVTSMETMMLILFCAFVLTSIINIFYSFKLLKKQEADKITKSAVIIKIGSIPFWVAMPAVVFTADIWRYDLPYIKVLFYIFLLGTSVSGISYIRLLHKQRVISLKQTVIHILMQFCFVLDIAAIARLKYSKGTVQPDVQPEEKPEAKPKVSKHAKTGEALAQIDVKIIAFFKGQWLKRKKTVIAVIGCLAALIIGLGINSFYQSRKPQPISVNMRVEAPETTGDPESRRPLSVLFRGSAAKVEMKDSEVPSGLITINPPIEGTWQWKGDDLLVFSTEEAWRIGKRYTVTFAKDFFPSHIKVDSGFNFEIPNITLGIAASEFYIDPEDSSIKRVLVTVQTNYPVDAASLEKNIRIEPRITTIRGS